MTRYKWIKIVNIDDLPPINAEVIVYNYQDKTIHKAIFTRGGFWNIDNILYPPGSFDCWFPMPV